MKKSLFLGLCIFAGFSASAQTALVKEADRDAKAGHYLEAIEKIKPAFTNPETEKDAFTYFVPGKAGFDYYKDQYVLKTIGKEADGKKMGHALLDGYGYLLTALQLDTVTDAKGKVKTKYSKNIIKLLQENYDQFNNAAVFMWDDKDFQGAYDAWEVIVTMPYNPVLGVNAPKAFPDSTVSDILFNQGLAAWQMDSIALSLASFEKAIAKGYDKPQAYDYAINHAARLGNNQKVYDLAEGAFNKFGNQNPLYLQLLINSRIEKQQYEEAAKMLDDAIAANPNDAQLYNIKGILYESMKDSPKAIEFYKKAIDVDSNNGQAQYNYGRMLCNQAYDMSDKAQSENMANDAYVKLRDEKINPLFKEAAVHLERALEIDPSNTDARSFLRNVYYNLGDEENLKRVENM